LEKSSRHNREDHPVARPLKNGAVVYIHHGTSRVAGKIAFRDNGPLEAGQKKVAELKLASPVFAFVGDHFVIRDSSEQNTIAGGIVLDPDGDGESLTSSTALDDIDSLVRVTTSRRGFARRENLLSKSQFSADEISDALIRLQGRGEIILRHHIAVDSKLWRKLSSQAARLIDEAHRQNPERAGVNLNEMRSALRIQRPELLEALVADLCNGDFIRKGSVVARTSHRPALPNKVQPVEKKVREALSKQPFDPPSRRTIESDPQARQVVRFLIENGEIIEIAPDVMLLRESFEQMKSQVAAFVLKNGPATVSDLRKALGSSRRVMVPLLERLDREGFTQRMGDKRCLR
jgi:selenocysteine-specific elongation factor